MKSVLVIGAGTMGNGIAHLHAQHGFHVTLVDVSEAAIQRGISTIDSNLSRQVKKGTLSEEDRTATLARITSSTDLRAAAANATRASDSQD